jgi:hypothetical protein
VSYIKWKARYGMAAPKKICTYCGSNIEGLDREALIECLRLAIEELETQRATIQALRDEAKR